MSTAFLNTEVGRVHHGDKVKVTVDSYRSKESGNRIILKCHLVIHGGKYYLNTHSLNNGGHYGVPKIEGYDNLYQFNPGSSCPVKFKVIVDRAEVPVATPTTPTSSWDVFGTPKQTYSPKPAPPGYLAAPQQSDGSITIRKRRIIQVNQNL